MKRKILVVSPLAVVLALPVMPAHAGGGAWEKPVVQECALEPGAECNVEVSCPADRPVVLGGGGGMPAASPDDHGVAITMSLPIADDTWRVRWKNLSGDTAATVKVAVRVRCAVAD